MIVSIEQLRTIPKNFFGIVTLKEEAVSFIIYSDRKTIDYSELFEFMESRVNRQDDEIKKPCMAEAWIESDSLLDFISDTEGLSEEDKLKSLKRANPGITPLHSWVDHSIFGDQIKQALVTLDNAGTAKIYDTDLNVNRESLAYNHDKDKFVYNGDITVYSIEDEYLNCYVFCSDFIDEEEYTMIHNLRVMILSYFAQTLNIKRGSISVVMSRFYRDDFNCLLLKRLSYEPLN